MSAVFFPQRAYWVDYSWIPELAWKSWYGIFGWTWEKTPEEVQVYCEEHVGSPGHTWETWWIWTPEAELSSHSYWRLSWHLLAQLESSQRVSAAVRVSPSFYLEFCILHMEYCTAYFPVLLWHHTWWSFAVLFVMGAPGRLCGPALCLCPHVALDCVELWLSDLLDFSLSPMNISVLREEAMSSSKVRVGGGKQCDAGGVGGQRLRAGLCHPQLVLAWQWASTPAKGLLVSKQTSAASGMAATCFAQLHLCASSVWVRLLLQLGFANLSCLPTRGDDFMCKCLQRHIQPADLSHLRSGVLSRL